MIEFIEADILEAAPRWPEDHFDLVFGSPPYCDARTYKDDTLPEAYRCDRGCREWVEWMLEVSLACARICKGPIFWVIAGVTRKRNYWPAPEGLMWEWWKRGGDCQLYRPCVFHRIGIPGSGGDDYLRGDWEYVVCLKPPGKLAWSDNTAMGHPPKWAPGGEMSHRLTDGERKNERHRKQTPSQTQRQNGAKGNPDYDPPEIANPGNLVQATYTADEVASLLEQAGDVTHHRVGGRQMGHTLAHQNEAPFPQTLAEFFVRSFCPEDGLVLDPFIGSGTTLAACQQFGRNGIGIDIRSSQIVICRDRFAQTTFF